MFCKTQWCLQERRLGLGRYRADVGLGVRLLLRARCMACTEDLRDGWRINRRGSFYSSAFERTLLAFVLATLLFTIRVV